MGDTIKNARETMAEAFRQDPDFRRGYVDNVACVLMDRLGIKDKDVRDPVASEIIHLIFET